jgi:hypothetical protein
MFASLLRQAATLAASALASEMRKPETQAKVAAAAQQAAAKMRDPETAKAVETAAMSGARALGRAFGNLKNR